MVLLLPYDFNGYLFGRTFIIPKSEFYLYFFLRVCLNLIENYYYYASFIT